MAPVKGSLSLIKLRERHISWAVQSLHAEGHKVDRAVLAVLSPYMTRQLKRFGDYVVDLQSVPQSLETAIPLPLEVAES